MYTAQGVQVMKRKLVRNADASLMSEAMAYIGFVAGLAVALVLLFL